MIPVLELNVLASPWGIILVTIQVFANQLGLPIPSEPILILAGAAVVGRPWLEAGLIASVAGAGLLADVIWFIGGRRFGNRVLGTICRLSATPDICAGETQGRFERWGANALLFAKFVPGLSLVAPPLAGAIRMSWKRFLSYSAVASVAWATAFVIGGTIFKQQIDLVSPVLIAHRFVTALVISSLVTSYLAYKWWARQRLYSRMRDVRVTVDALRSLIDTGQTPVIVDVRSHTARHRDPRQILGAVHVIPGEMELHIARIPQDRDVILYCACPSEATAAQVAGLLIKRGLKRVRPLVGGLEAWVAAGHPTEPVPIRVG